ncbi:hypothetical protein N7448_000006 [Penicillium atrosanguineum]|nr:hypothetical protein N7448_000006 [Penicillium atrosanguineum]
MTGSIDLPLINLTNSDFDAAGRAVLDAAVTYGFLYIDSRATVFSSDDVNRVFGMAEEFFQLPVPDKARYRRGSDNKGWVGMNVETLDPEHHERGDFKEAFNIGELQDEKVKQPLPACLMSRETDIARFTNLCNKTCDQILRLLARGLEIPNDFFASRHDPAKGCTGNSLRLLYYPESASSYRPDKDIRAGAHSDYGSITLLFQRPGQPGLEILTSDQKWAPVPVYPGDPADFPFPPILVNIGDMLSYWTDGLLKSTVHRVVFPHSDHSGVSSPARDRFSIAFFCQPVGSTELIPVPSKVVNDYRREKQDVNLNLVVGYGGGANALDIDQHRLTAGEHLQSRLAATYNTIK